MQDADRHDLIQHLMLETTVDGTGSRSESAQDLSVLVVAALLAGSTDDLLADALRLATATPDRQLLAIAAAYLAGDHDRVEALAGDHLLDHPAIPVLAWVVAHGRSAATHPSQHPTEEPNP
jgi:hypothetical protein